MNQPSMTRPAPTLTPRSSSPVPPGAAAGLLVEEGAAFARLTGLDSAPDAPAIGRPAGAPAPERHTVVVIGGGQAGLSMGYHLRRLGIDFVILDAGARVGDSWRKRWDSLRLFTPARFNGLDGMPFPAPPESFPTKDEMGDYLEAYAKRFDLPVRNGMRVERLIKDGDRYIVFAGGRQFLADHVVVAMGHYQKPKRPAFAAQLDPSVRQMHSVEYRNPAQLKPGDVLLVGAGNTGSELARELNRSGHTVWMSGRDVGEIPFRIESWIGQKLMVRVVLRLLFHRLLTIDTPMGRKARPNVLRKGGPLIRVKGRDLVAAGVHRVPRVAGIEAGRPRLEDGRVLDVANVIWCTGFHPGFEWIEADVLDPDGEPRHQRGVVPGEPGLYFTGLAFQYALSSSMVHGTGRDARHVAECIDSRLRSGARTATADPRVQPAAALAAAS